MKQLNPCYEKAILAICFYLLLSVTKTNAQWGELGGTNTSTFNFSINSIAIDGSGNLYAGGSHYTNGNSYVAKWDGNTWSELGGSKTTFNDNINSIATDAIGNVYAAGDFTNANGNYYVAKWNGSNWSEIGGANTSTFNDDIESITTDANGYVYAVGGFTDANGNTYVAKWDGSNWSELGGTNPSLGGRFITKDAKGNIYTTSGYGVAKWDGSAWNILSGIISPFGSEFIASINTDAKGNVYAAENFNDSAGNEFIAEWNGSSWSKLGALNIISPDSGTSLTTDASGNLYAGLMAYNNNNSPIYYVSKWDGNTWGIVGNDTTFNSDIYSMAVDASGNLYAGGNFVNANGNYYVAKWNLTLPVTLENITAKQENKDIAINWQTATELNTSHFNVQRSTDGVSFTDIGTAKAIGSGANKYGFIDNNPADGINYYRLQIVDMDGAATYSKVVSCELSVVSKQITVYPNPSRDNVTISGSHISSLQVIDNIGRVVKVVSLKDATNPSLSVSGLPAGVYHLRVQTSDGSMSGVGFVKE
jgi:hypothetical protein